MMMICRRVLLALSLLFLTNGAQASINTLTLSGKVVSAPGFATSVAAGDDFTITYSFDTTVAARPTSTSQFAVFDALTDYELVIGGFTYQSTSALEIQVDNDPGFGFHDRYAVISRASDGLAGPSFDGFEVNAAAFRLDDSTDAVFSDALTLPTSLDFTKFDSSGFFMFFTGVDDSLFGVITGIVPGGTDVVPEPATILVWSVLALTAAGCQLHKKFAA